MGAGETAAVAGRRKWMGSWLPPSLQSSPRLGPALAAATYFAAGTERVPPSPCGSALGGAARDPFPPPAIARPRGCQQWETRGEKGGIRRQVRFAHS